MQEEIICPYPGLRPFNEDEAIFFKGRDEHIEQIVKQLEEKKFLMLTGASGDGKSSLVYAGVIPNARAGFFKAKFNNWIVADFRPEREPLKNMAIALNEQLKINDVNRVEKQLSYGFSSLIDIYKSSPYWIDQQSEEFKGLGTDEQKKAKRKGANLLILVDQFEEFFTNPENYVNGKTSIESQAVVNSLLETTRLCIEQDVPIYIVCTMRSDYIGQCASFRGLPEYIGYSQFFVPRLKRKEIYQVIEEPAQLNGNRISKRLVEMLINEMNDGIDQLPVLQHALNQIWQQADKGNIEMDLIHFAKINGIPRNQLTSTDKTEFENWFAKLPDFKKEFFTHSSLGDVLDAHANELFEIADTVSKENINKTDAKLIVETTFKCLTKIDEARAVRNRMTLEEVTHIINKPSINANTVAHILYNYRIQGNTFLKPFIFNVNEATIELAPNTVLDITHESLIRNWKKLTEWAKEEYENHLTWQDFNKQLQRWVTNKKSSGYLLPIGSLTFFENWFNTIKPNKHWLARYDEREVTNQQKLIDAETTLDNAQQFIKRSARRLFINRTVIKYGADKIIAVFGVLLLVIGCTYFYFDFSKKQNDYVVKDLQQKSNELLKSKYIKNKIKAEYLIVAERLNPGIYKKLLQNIEGDSAQIEVMREMFSNCLAYQEGKKDDEPNNPLVGTLFLDQLKLIEDKQVFQSNKSLVRNINNILGIVYGQIILKRNNYPINDNGNYRKFCYNSFTAFTRLLRDTSVLKKIEPDQFNRFLQTIPEIADYDSLKLKQVTDLLNPFNPKTKIIFDVLYPKEKTVKQNWSGNLTHNGGYYQMANLFALTNNFQKLNMSFDSILTYNKNFLNSGYGYTYHRLLYDLIITDNFLSANAKVFLNKIESKLAVKKNFSLNVFILNNLLTKNNDVNIWHLRDFNKADNTAADLQLQLERISYAQVNNLSEGIINDIQTNNKNSLDEKNYLSAILYKAIAFSNNKKENFNLDIIKQNIYQALECYEKVSLEYLDANINIGEGNIVTTTRSKVFKTGGMVSITSEWGPFEYYNTLMRYKEKAIFVNTVVKRKGLKNFYCNNDEDANVLNDFLLDYLGNNFNYSNNKSIILDLQPFLECIRENTLNKKIDKDVIFSFLTCYNYGIKQNVLAGQYAKQINFKQFINREKLNATGQKSYTYYSLSYSLLNYYFNKPFKPFSNEDGNTDDSNKQSFDFKTAFQLLYNFPDAFQKRNALIINIDSLQRNKKDVIAIALMDSLLNSHILKTSKFGNKFFEVLGRLSTSNGDIIAMLLMKDKSDKIKPNCLNFFINGKAQSGNYYQATTFIPDYVSSSSQLELYTTILKNELIKRRTAIQDGWFSMDFPNTQYDWVNSPYENSDSGVNYIQSE